MAAETSGPSLALQALMELARHFELVEASV
jgi:hypothetical protein